MSLITEKSLEYVVRDTFAPLHIKYPTGQVDCENEIIVPVSTKIGRQNQIDQSSLKYSPAGSC